MACISQVILSVAYYCTPLRATHNWVRLKGGQAKARTRMLQHVLMRDASQKEAIVAKKVIAEFETGAWNGWVCVEAVVADEATPAWEAAPGCQVRVIRAADAKLYLSGRCKGNIADALDKRNGGIALEKALRAILE